MTSFPSFDLTRPNRKKKKKKKKNEKKGEKKKSRGSEFTSVLSGLQVREGGSRGRGGGILGEGAGGYLG